MNPTTFKNFTASATHPMHPRAALPVPTSDLHGDDKGVNTVPNLTCLMLPNVPFVPPFACQSRTNLTAHSTVPRKMQSLTQGCTVACTIAFPNTLSARSSSAAFPLDELVAVDDGEAATCVAPLVGLLPAAGTVAVRSWHSFLRRASMTGRLSRLYQCLRAGPASISP